MCSFFEEVKSNTLIPETFSFEQLPIANSIHNLLNRIFTFSTDKIKGLRHASFF